MKNTDIKNCCKNSYKAKDINNEKWIYGQLLYESWIIPRTLGASYDFWLLPDREEVEKMVSEYSYVGGPLNKISVNGGNPPAYTLDVAVIERNNEYKTAVLEVHNFVSCGLYGFNHPAILLMLKKGWEWEKKRAILLSEIHPSLKTERKD